MSLWNPDAVVSIPAMMPSLVAPVVAPPEPHREAARLASLKRLRHRLVQEAAGQKLPVLVFERWLARSSLQTDSQTDPIIPTNRCPNGGLIKDLARGLKNLGDSRRVAAIMADEGNAAAQRVMEFTRDTATATAPAALPTNDLPDRNHCWSAQIKSCARRVKTAAKAARTALLPPTTNVHDDDSLKNSLQALHQSSQRLLQCIETAQRETGMAECISITRLNRSTNNRIYKVALKNDTDGTLQKPYLTISSCHLEKLLRLWRFTAAVRKSDDTDAIVADIDQAMDMLPDKSLFLASLYCCLARYECLKGAGYQCAVPAPAFDALARMGLGNVIECFASPLNCRHRIYCSAFPDIEKRFGSLGSFFDDEAFFPLEGSFEANPPFVPEMMEAMGDKIIKLLGNGRAKALSFLVVIPAWGDGLTYYQDLKASQYARASSIISAADHAFCDGAQHTQSTNQDGSVLLRPSSWDTAVILLQNDAGLQRWPVEHRQLEDSFCKALRSTSASAPDRTIKAWEQRVHNPQQAKRKRH